jgi:hypothetical protein
MLCDGERAFPRGFLPSQGSSGEDRWNENQKQEEEGAKGNPTPG